jgi:hypothetical protein
VPEPNEFTCYCCGGTFTKERTDEEAMAEYRDTFGEAERAEGVSFCDECYEQYIVPELEKSGCSPS